jgi:hypothetical protein
MIRPLLSLESLSLDEKHGQACGQLNGPDDVSGILADGRRHLLELNDDLDLSFEGQVCQSAAPSAFFPENLLSSPILH